MLSVERIEWEHGESPAYVMPAEIPPTASQCYHRIGLERAGPRNSLVDLTTLHPKIGELTLAGGA